MSFLGGVGLEQDSARELAARAPSEQFLIGRRPSRRSSTSPRPAGSGPSRASGLEFVRRPSERDHARDQLVDAALVWSWALVIHSLGHHLSRPAWLGPPRYLSEAQEHTPASNHTHVQDIGRPRHGLLALVACECDVVIRACARSMPSMYPRPTSARPGRTPPGCSRSCTSRSGKACPAPLAAYAQVPLAFVISSSRGWSRPHPHSGSTT